MIRFIERDKFEELAKAFDFNHHGADKLSKYHWDTPKLEQAEIFKKYFEEFLYLMSVVDKVSCMPRWTPLTKKDYEIAKWINNANKCTYVKTFDKFQVVYNKNDNTYYVCTEEGVKRWNEKDFIYVFNKKVPDNAACIEYSTYEDTDIVTLLHDVCTSSFNMLAFRRQYEVLCNCLKAVKNNAQYDDEDEE